MSKCSIVFGQNPSGVFYAGQEVSGYAELTTIRPKTIRSIYISVSGYAEVRWTENIMKQDTHGQRQKALETFSASELYYSTEKNVFGQSDGSQIELPAGKYKFPFQATIPPNAPTSYNGSYGKIQHEVLLVIDRVMRYDNTFRQPYTVISPYDLNSRPDNSKALHKIDEKKFWWGMCVGNNGPMVIDVNVPYSCYAPGQKIHFNVVFDNQSNVTCTDFKVRLMKKTVFTSSSPDTKTQVTEVKVSDNHCGEVLKLNKAVFNEFLQIPSTTPTSLDNCNIIKVSYTLKFIAKVYKVHGGSLVIEFPLTIGTVPLKASVSNAISAPSFEEDVRSEQFEDNKFRPRYPVYLLDGGLSNNKAEQFNNSIPAVVPTNHIYPPVPVTKQQNPSAMPMPVLSTPSAPPPPPSGYGAPSPNVEALGFSLPPGYQPTPHKTEPQSTSVGWK